MAPAGSFDAGALRRLARRRPQFRSRHLSLAWSELAGAPHGPVLAVAVPKRIVPSAPLRNAVRRVAREAWRQGCRAGGVDAPLLALLRLRALPQRESGSGLVGNGGGDQGVVANRHRHHDQSGKAGGRQMFAARLTDRALKRVLRAECDRLMAELARALRSERGAVRCGAGSESRVAGPMCGERGGR